MVIYGTDRLTARSQAVDLLAAAAAEHWSLSPMPEVLRHGAGKPYFAARPDLQFNLSHSGPLALCALDNAPVGVDIQVVKQWRPSLPRRVCSEEEHHWLEGQPDFWAAFTRIWTLKEARAKESGRGLRAPIRDIRVPLPDRCPCALDGLWFGSYTGDGWAAAVCGHGRPPEKILWR